LQQRKQIDQERWSDYLSQVTAGDRGRHISLDVVGQTPESPETTGGLAPVVSAWAERPFCPWSMIQSTRAMRLSSALGRAR
jgi:hypothetical protein